MGIYPLENWETDFNVSPRFKKLYDEFCAATLQDDPEITNRLVQRFHILWHYANIVSKLDGDFVECGVYHGHSAFFLASMSRNKVHLFDSWEGIQDVTKFDNDFYLENKYETNISSAKIILGAFENIEYHHGAVPFDFDKVEKISLLHIDMGVYTPTKTALEGLWDKVVDGGVVIVDYHEGFSIGAKKAATEFFSRLGKNILILPTGKAVVVK